MNFCWVGRIVIVRVGDSALVLSLYIMAPQRKKIREKGKLRLSQYFKKIDDGANVAVVTDVGVRAMFPKRLKGMNGKVVGSRGKFKLVQIKTGDKMKTFVIHPVHLRVLR